MQGNLNDGQMDEILSEGYYGHLGCHKGDEQYVIPITYVWDNGFICSYTHEGKKIDMMRANPTVCVQVERVLSPIEWESVICWGEFEEVKDDAQSKQIRLLLADQFGKMSERSTAIMSPMIHDLSAYGKVQGKPVVVYRIRVAKRTGKFEHP